MDVLLNARRELRCIFSRSDPEIRRARWLTAAVLVLANIGGAAITFAIGFFAFPAGSVEPGGVRLLAIATSIYLAATLAMGTTLALRSSARAEAVLTSGDAIAPGQLRSILDDQWRHTVASGIYWAGGAVMVGILLGPVLGLDPVLVGRDVLTVVLGGLTTCALAFLLLERGMRPIVMRLREALPEVAERAPSVRQRLLLAWLLGSGIPLIGIALTLLEEQHSDRTRLFVLLGLLTGAGIFVGAYTSILAAGSVADPLRALNTTMQRVAQGDLDATVPIADSGEIGDLQLRFNRMTAGLRERERLRELFGRHVGVEVARYAMEHHELGGEQRQVSVLFIDLRGSTALAEKMAPEHVVAMLNDLFSTVIDAVEAEGGWANKFEGDAALCIFGAPLPQDDHARRALRAARTLAASLDGLRARHQGLDAGIGVASGIVVAGNVGSRQRYEYTVIGDPVNVAARLCTLAKSVPSRLLADSSTVDAAADAEGGHWEAHGEVEIRGRERLVRAYSARTTVGASTSPPARDG